MLCLHTLAQLLDFFECTNTNEAMNNNRNKNPRNNRLIHYQIGMIVALILVFSAFEFKSYENYEVSLKNRDVEEIPVEIILPTRHKKKEIKPPTPKFKIEIVDDNTLDVDEIPDVDVLADENTLIEDDWLPDLSKDEPEIDDIDFVLIAPVMPEFNGGTAAMMKYITQNIKYPKLAAETGISGRVFVGFIVEKDGSLSNIELLRSIGGGCDEEALRVVRSMPLWNPGMQRGMPVRVKLTLPVKFTLK